MSLPVSAAAPDATLPSQDQTPVTLSTLWKKGVLVLYFYPKDGTPGCTAEACSFRDQFDDFKEAGATVVGVSDDSAESHTAFQQKHRLNFPLLSDKGGQLRRAYQVEKTLGLINGRTTFVIDQSGTIRHVFTSQFNATRHVKEALQVVRSLKMNRAQ